MLKKKKQKSIRENNEFAEETLVMCCNCSATVRIVINDNTFDKSQYLCPRCEMGGIIEGDEL